MGLLSGLVAGCSPDDKDEPTPAPSSSDPKLRFIGDWSCKEVSRRDPPAQPFQIHCINSTGDSVHIENFYALGFQYKAKAIIIGDSIKFSPSNQTVSPGIFLLGGKGKLINSTKFTMTYIVDDGNSVKDTVDATFTK